jgi:formylmethanofuran dehydrogenase subunit E
MFRILFALLIIYLLYVLWKRTTHRVSDHKKNFERRDVQHDLAPGEMVACAKCHTFVLKSEAYEKGGKFYCSRDCSTTKASV